MLKRATDVLLLVGIAAALAKGSARTNGDEQAAFRSHPAMRPALGLQKRPLVAGSKLFVDPVRGDDGAPAAEQAPLMTLKAALHRLQPGDLRREDSNSTCRPAPPGWAVG